MTRFTGAKTTKLNLSETEHVEVKESVPFESYRELMKLSDYGKGDASASFMPLLKLALVNWNFRDENDLIVPCTTENIEKLDAKTVLELVDLILPLYTPDKKKSTGSSGQ